MSESKEKLRATLLELNLFLPKSAALSPYLRLVNEFSDMGGFFVRLFADDLTGSSLFRPVTQELDKLGLTPYTAIHGSGTGGIGRGVFRTPVDVDLLSTTKLHCIAIMVDATALRDVSYIQNVRNILKTDTKLELYLKIRKDTINLLEPTVEFCLQEQIPACIVEVERYSLDSNLRLGTEEYQKLWRTCENFNLSYNGTLRLSLADCPYLNATAQNVNSLGGCTAGLISCSVNWEGTILPCFSLPEIRLGSIYQDSLRSVWTHSETLLKLRDRTGFHGRCAKCVWLWKCGGCRAESYYGRSGDLFGADDSCWTFQEERTEVAD